MLNSYMTKAASRFVQAIPIAKLTIEIMENVLLRHQLRRTSLSATAFMTFVLIRIKAIPFLWMSQRIVLFSSGNRKFV